MAPSLAQRQHQQQESPQRKKKSLRRCVMPPGWQLPPSNLLQLYLEACEQQGVVALTGVASQLLRRVRTLQPLPYHRTFNQDRHQLLSTLVQHLDPGGTGMVSAQCAEVTLSMLNPRLDWREAVARGAPEVAAHWKAQEERRMALRGRNMLAYATQRFQLDPMPFTAFASAAESATSDLPDADVAQAVLECLVVPGQGVSAANPDLMFRCLFHHLDVSSEGYVSVEDFTVVALQLFPAGSLQQLQEAACTAQEKLQEAACTASGQPREAACTAQEKLQDAARTADGLQDTGTSCRSSCPATAAAAVAALLAQLRKQCHERITESEFVLCMAHGVLPLSGMSADQAESIVLELMERRVRPLHKYDFSRDYLGAAGLVPLVTSLYNDPTFASLDLSHTGVADSCCSLLHDWLKDHPGITSLDLSHNPIGDSGGVVLTALLNANPRIANLNVEGTHFMRHYSRDHHNDLGPSGCEDGLPLHAALHRNQAARSRQPRELIQLLRASAPELRALFVALQDQSTGKVPLARVCEEVREIAYAWGFASNTIDTVLRSERLLGTGGQIPDGTGTISTCFAEFMHFLDREDITMRVLHAIKHHRVAVKRIFHQLLDVATQQPQQPPLQQPLQQPGQDLGSHSSDNASAVRDGSALTTLCNAASAAAASQGSPGGDGMPGKVFVLAPLDGAGPKLSLGVLRQALLELASQPGSGWGISAQDLEAVLQPITWADAPAVTPVATAAPCASGGDASPSLGGAAAYEAGGVGGMAGGAPREDVALSWPAFFNTVLHLMQR